MVDGCRLVRNAEAIARRRHGEVEQKRKYTLEPYTEHLEAVANLTAQAGGTPEMIAAAWLHDVLEDTEATAEEIEGGCNSEVLHLVLELTDISKPEDGNRALRKAKDRAHIAAASNAAKTIKLADLIDNATSIIDHDPGFAQVFMREFNLLLEVLQDGELSLLRRATQISAAYAQTK